jgi:hypothetical protein
MISEGAYDEAELNNRTYKYLTETVEVNSDSKEVAIKDLYDISKIESKNNLPNEELKDNLSDNYIFDLENFDWFKVELYSHVHDFKILSRCSHQSVVYSNKLLIFGGMNSNNYLGSSLLIVNLDFYYFPKLKSTEEIMIEKLQSTKDPSAKHKIEKLKHQIQKNQLGLVTQMSLPPIK